MSNLRQSGDDSLIRTYAVSHPPRLHLSARSYADWDQLIYAVQGAMEVRTPNDVWLVPPRRAAWIPAGTECSVIMNGPVSLRALFFATHLTREVTPRVCQTVNVGPLLNELILHANRLAALRACVPEHQRLTGVIVDQVRNLEATPLQLPLPASATLIAVANSIRKAPGRADVRALAESNGVSKRTLERSFLAETGIPIGRWRHRARLIAALRMLAEGRPVASIAEELGYNGSSAFIAAFRRELGTTPKKYYEAQPRSR